MKDGTLFVIPSLLTAEILFV